jgi:hypothetical protein
MLKQNIGRIDHVAILVYPQNFESCVERLARALQLSFQRAHREDLGLKIATDWDAGLEILAPTGPESALWSQLQKRGEGHMSIIFGVKDFEEARKRAEREGFSAGPEVGLIGSEPWADRFSVLRETSLSEICGINLVLGQVEPRY